MKNIQKSGFLIVTFLLLLISQMKAAVDEIPPRPDPPRLVNDFTGTLNDDEISMLETRLVNFNDTTSTQIVVVLVNSLGDYDKAQFADLLGEKWGVGQKGKNNGIVLLIKPKTSSSGGEAFIAPGYGLEAVVPDITTKQIVEDEMIPYFSKNRYFDGIEAGTNILMKLTSKEFTADQYMKRSRGNGGTLGFLLPFLIVIIIFVKLLGGRRGMRSVGGKSGSSLPFWTALFLANQMGNHHSGKWNDFSSGGGSFGGFGGGGGGGFGGFGGGSFGGGGAGGSW
jgi:uncharacterized protein